MNLKSKTMKLLHETFHISEPQSWCRVSAAEVLSIDGVGKTALNKLRLYLAERNLSLRGDNPPSYWKSVLTQSKQENAECHGICPFTIVIDTNETYPFSFDMIRDRDNNLVSVPTIRKALWTIGLADYTIQGMEDAVQLERKAEDLASSLSERRPEFEAEIERLSNMCEYAAVVCEHPWRDILSDSHNHGARAKSISRTVLSWQIKYPGVHWWFCEGRHHAEQVAFRLLEKFYWHRMFSSVSSDPDFGP